MAFWQRVAAAAVMMATGMVPIGAVAQQKPIDVIIALPAPTLTFSAPFLAEDAGLYKKEGLNVSHRMLVGVEAVNAVIAGSADFTISTGPVFLRAAAKGQRLLAIANLIDRPLVELVLRKDVYDALHVTDGMSLAQRGALLKGKTIAIQGVGSIIHAWERFVAARGGLDPETDVRIAPMDPPAMLGALQTKAVDGFATSPPFTTQAVLNGSAMMLASAPQGIAPDMIPFPYGLVMTEPQTCQRDPDKCRRVMRALAAATKMIRDQPEKALGILSKRFNRMDPKVLETAWTTVSQAHASDLRVTPALLAKGDRMNVEAKLLDPKDQLKSYDGLYTDKYLP
ncbi:MAG TPA: ABC transporter substrate-binding protein [Stellaceae bacterium]|nr:ABC transporter substrate-binding protein [Stellaceae bacterium]